MHLKSINIWEGSWGKQASTWWKCFTSNVGHVRNGYRKSDQRILELWLGKKGNKGTTKEVVEKQIQRQNTSTSWVLWEQRKWSFYYKRKITTRFKSTTFAFGAHNILSVLRPVAHQGPSLLGKDFPGPPSHPFPQDVDEGVQHGGYHSVDHWGNQASLGRMVPAELNYTARLLP